VGEKKRLTNGKKDFKKKRQITLFFPKEKGERFLAHLEQ
jgi:hypothetical protein